MKKERKITILGSGSAHGTPNVCNDWGNVKNKSNSKNKRTCASSFIEINGINFLIDMSPSYREQINNNNIQNIDAIFLTHSHFDHICSIGGDLWRTTHVLQKQISVFCYKETFENIKDCFPYLFKAHKEKGSNNIIWVVLNKNESFSFKNIEWQTFQVKHKNISTTVFRHKDFAIVMDLETLTQENKDKLKNLNLLILECNNGTEVLDNGHNNWAQTSKWIEELKPQRTILTHLSNRLDHEEFELILPSMVELAYDGMVVE